MKRLFAAVISLFIGMGSTYAQEVAGVKFGESYDSAIKKLINKFGDASGKTRDMILFDNIIYAGVEFDHASFHFQYSTDRSYLHMASFIVKPKSEKEVKNIMDNLKDKLSSKYETKEEDDVLFPGRKIYMAGQNPKNASRPLIILSDQSYGGLYELSLSYGPIEFITEEL